MTRRQLRRLKRTDKFWIFCEGETGKNYFKKFKATQRIRRIDINPIVSQHKNPDGMVEEALKFMECSSYQKGDLIACVFDRDNNTNNQFEKAKSLAGDDIKLIFSNPCIEYWLLSHFIYSPSSYEPRELKDKISEYIPNYKESDLEIYSKTKDKIDTAIKNTKKMTKKHLDSGKALFVRETNPLSLVYEVVEKINEFR